MRIIVIEDDASESPPLSLEDLRDRLDLGMVEADQPCRILGGDGGYVVGELVTGTVFREMDEAPALDWEDGAETAADEPEEMDEPAPARPLWSAHPSLLAFPSHLLVTLLLPAAAMAAWQLEWSGWLAAALAATSCLCASLLLARRASIRYAVFPGHLGFRRGFLFRRRLLIPRAAVVSLEIERGLAAWAGLADLVVTFRRGPKFATARMRNIRGARRALRLWEQHEPQVIWEED